MLPVRHDGSINGRRHAVNTVIFETSVIISISNVVVGRIRRFLDTPIVVKHGAVGFLANG